MATKTLRLIISQSIGAFFLLSASVALTLAFHFLHISGSVFLPLYFIVILGAYTMAPQFSLATAIIIPLLNYLLTGMPPTSPIPMLQILVIELCALALATTYLRKTNLFLGIKLLSSIVIARFSAILLVTSSMISWSFFVNHLLESVPGILLNTLLAYFVLSFLKNERNENS